MKYSHQIFKHSIDAILAKCTNRDDNKSIIIASTAAKATEIRNKLDTWLDMKSDIEGDTVLVVGNQETETKFAYTTEFTNTQFGSNGIKYSDTKLCP